MSLSSETHTTLLYVHDPMCSWCWAFRPVLQALRRRLSKDVAYFKPLLGGLAPDTDATMPADMRVYLQDTWHHIEHRVPGTRFNHEFWTRNTPRRATYPACRALIAARRQQAALYDAMLFGIQNAYYLEARNPSDRNTLIDIAKAVGCDVLRFANELEDADTEHELRQEIAHVQSLGIRGFPSLVLQHGDARYQPLTIDFHSVDRILEQIEPGLAG